MQVSFNMSASFTINHTVAAVFKVLPLVKLKPTIDYNWQPFAAFICNETLNGYW
jgi:hypothetical protein